MERGSPGALLPTFSRTEPRLIFRNIPASDLVVDDRLIRYWMRQAGEHKIALRAAAVTGRVGYLFEQVCSFDNLYRAFRKALRGTGKTAESCQFHFHLEKELLALKHEIESGIYQAAPYRYFRIFDPKERTISVAPFRDRVVHHAVVGVLEPVFGPAFIFDSYATRKGKGTHRAVKRAQSFLKSSRYYLKLRQHPHLHM